MGINPFPPGLRGDVSSEMSSIEGEKQAREGGEEGDFTVKETSGQHPHVKFAKCHSTKATCASAHPML